MFDHFCVSVSFTGGPFPEVVCIAGFIGVQRRGESWRSKLAAQGCASFRVFQGLGGVFNPGWLVRHGAQASRRRGWGVSIQRARSGLGGPWERASGFGTQRRGQRPGCVREASLRGQEIGGRLSFGAVTISWRHADDEETWNMSTSRNKRFKQGTFIEHGGSLVVFDRHTVTIQTFQTPPVARVFIGRGGGPPVLAHGFGPAPKRKHRNQLRCPERGGGCPDWRPRPLAGKRAP